MSTEETEAKIAELQAQLKAEADKKAKRKIRKAIRKLRKTIDAPTTGPTQPATAKAAPAARTRKVKVPISVPASPIPHEPFVPPESLKLVDWDPGITGYGFAGQEFEIPQMLVKFQARWGYPAEWFAKAPQLNGYVFGPVKAANWVQDAIEHV